MLTWFLAMAARFGGPLIVKFAPWLIPFAGWVRPVFRGLVVLLLVGVVAYATWWLTSPSDAGHADLHAQCQVAIDKAARVAWQTKQSADAKAQEAASRARATLYADLDEANERIAALERELSKQPDDPVAFPRSIARELRR